MSVCLTIRLRPEQECVVDCLAQSQHPICIRVEVSDGMANGGNAIIGHNRRDAEPQNERIHGVPVPNDRNMIEGNNRLGILPNAGVNALGGFGQIGTSMSNLPLHTKHDPDAP